MGVRWGYIYPFTGDPFFSTSLVQLEAHSDHRHSLLTRSSSTTTIIPIVESTTTINTFTPIIQLSYCLYLKKSQDETHDPPLPPAHPGLCSPDRTSSRSDRTGTYIPIPPLPNRWQHRILAHSSPLLREKTVQRNVLCRYEQQG